MVDHVVRYQGDPSPFQGMPVGSEVEWSSLNAMNLVKRAYRAAEQNEEFECSCVMAAVDEVDALSSSLFTQHAAGMGSAGLMDVLFKAVDVHRKGTRVLIFCICKFDKWVWVNIGQY